VIAVRTNLHVKALPEKVNEPYVTIAA